MLLLNFAFGLAHSWSSVMQSFKISTLYTSFKNVLVACFKSGSFIFRHIGLIYTRLNFYSKEVCLLCTQK